MQFHTPAASQAQPMSLASAKDHTVPQAFKVLEQLHSAVMKAQPQEPGHRAQSLSQPNFWDSSPQRKLPSITATKHPFLHPLAANCCGRMLWHFPALQIFTWTPLLCTDHTWRREQQRFLPNFQLVLPCASGKPWLGGSTRSTRAASSFCGSAADSSQCPQGAGGGCFWVGACATSLVSRARVLSSSAAAEEAPV